MADSSSRAGRSFATPAILRYVDDLHAAHDRPLQDAFAAPERNAMPAINIGASEGKTLHLLLRLIGARKVVELGTLAGYSTIWMARALPAGGHLWTIESDPKHAAVATQCIDAAGLGPQISVMIGVGREVLPRLEPYAPFDAVFIDADKGNYDDYGRWAARHLRAGGLMLGDNAYLSGRLLDDSPDAEAMRRFHDEAREHFDTVCLPTPDGMLLGIKR
jgi:caffeoyl-CoA O-methyltransferase